MSEIEYGYEVCRLSAKQKTPGGAIREFNARRIIIDFVRVTPGDLI